ncbi:hypothetical protein [Maricaulis sp.]|uniref:hypothetical protein n=1 Tax=Maricaulis sp. TaxID=1486257 RepID=UPI00261A1007|nr:hypothetical protein [Maricaulis sp.]
MSRSTSRTAVSAAYATACVLLLVQTAWVAFWLLAIPVVWAGWWDGHVAGLDGRNIVAHMRLYLLPVAFIYLASIPAALVCLLRGRKTALWIYLFSVSLHAAIWFNLLTNPYYDGRLSGIVLALETAIAFLLYLLVLWRRLH